MTKDLDKVKEGVLETDTPIWDWFELSYASYLTIPRVVLQTMPTKWQKDFVKLMNELDDTIDWRRSGAYTTFRNHRGRYMRDDLNDYRHKVYTPEQISEMVDEHNERRFK